MTTFEVFHFISTEVIVGKRIVVGPMVYHGVGMHGDVK
jgi:hypothetical protein